MNKVSKKYPNDAHKMEVLSIIEESTPKRIRMASLCIVGSHKVNGVAELHSQLLRQNLFKDFHEFKEHFERLFIQHRLKANEWNISKTADELNIQLHLINLFLFHLNS